MLEDLRCCILHREAGCSEGHCFGELASKAKVNHFDEFVLAFTPRGAGSENRTTQDVNTFGAPGPYTVPEPHMPVVPESLLPCRAVHMDIMCHTHTHIA